MKTLDMFEKLQYESFISNENEKKGESFVKKECSENADQVVYGCQFCPSLIFKDYTHLHQHLEEHAGKGIIVKEEFVEETETSHVEFFMVDENMPAESTSGSFDEELDDYEHEKPENDSDVTYGHSKSTKVRSASKRKGKRFRHRKVNRDMDSESSPNGGQRRTASDGIVDEEELICKICGKKFTRKHSVIVHQRIHTGERPFECKECGAKFKQNGDLKMHLTTHLGLKPYTCEVCNVPFRRRGDVNRHMLVHSGTRPHKCKECGKDFSRASHLKLHWESKHEEAGFEGKQRETDVEAALMKPRERHPCSVCGKFFKSKRNLKEHQRIHTGQKPFQCAVCGKAFFHSGSFNIHKRIHTGDRPYSCSKCNLKFICSSALGRHFRKAHAESE